METVSHKYSDSRKLCLSAHRTPQARVCHDMTRDSVGVTCDGVAVLGASQPQLSVHDSGNSKLGYTWPGCHQPPGRRCCAIPGHCHRPGCTIATTAALSPEEKSEPSSDVESGHAGDTGDRDTPPLQCCSAAVLQAGSAPRAGPACCMGTIAAYSHTGGGT